MCPILIAPHLTDNMILHADILPLLVRSWVHGNAAVQRRVIHTLPALWSASTIRMLAVNPEALADIACCSYVCV